MAAVIDWIFILSQNSYVEIPTPQVTVLRGEILGVWLGYTPEKEMALQYFCLDNSMDGGAWQATVHGVTKIRL